MHNRQPTPGKEGRVLITPENGGAPYHAAIVMADDPIEEGTLFAKETMLTNPTAALFRLGDDALPNDVFAFLGKYNQHWWKYRYLTSQYVLALGSQSTVIVTEEKSEIAETTITYYNSVTVDRTDGTIVLGESGTLTLNYRNYTKANELRGKYFRTVAYGVVGNTLYYCPKSSSADDYKVLTSPPRCCIRMALMPVSSMYVVGGGEWQYVYSSDRNAYPDGGEVDGKEYNYIGIPFDNAVTAPKVEVGSYVGTGTSGADSPNTLTFNIEATFVMIQRLGTGAPIGTNYSGASAGMTVMRGQDRVYTCYPENTNYTTYANLTWGHRSLSWYAMGGIYADLSAGQLNEEASTYIYVAIG